MYVYIYIYMCIYIYIYVFFCLQQTCRAADFLAANLAFSRSQVDTSLLGRGSTHMRVFCGHGYKDVANSLQNNVNNQCGPTMCI